MKTFSIKPKADETIEEISCPICSTHSLERDWILEDYAFTRCKSCGNMYQSRRPVKSDLEARYDSEYFQYEIENEKNFLDLMLKGINDVGFDLNKKGSVLDIGCATGIFLGFMKEKGWSVQGVEICAPAARYGIEKRGVPISIGTLEDAELEDGIFDVVHISHVIEHVTDPAQFIQDIFRVLKPGGILYCTTPNIAGFQAKLFKERWRSAIADHMVLFSVHSLKQLLRSEGFKIDCHKTWGGLCLNSGYPKLLKSLLDKLAKPMGFGDVMIIKGQKPL